MYYFIYGFLYLVSLLPFWILYRISDFFYLVVYYVLGYRKEIVMNNLAIAFPEKSGTEKKKIAKEFYHNLIDNFIETIKLLSISEKHLHKRFSGDHAVFHDQYIKGKNIQIHLGHLFNWEYANLILSWQMKYRLLVVYMPIINKAVNRIFYKLRTRFNTKLIAATTFRKDFKEYSHERFCIVFVADQNPGNTQACYWSNFFGKLTPFVTGPEKSARLYNTVVLMGKLYKVKRGCYHFTTEILTTEPRSLNEGELTKRMIASLEDNIRQSPANYLWSHRRWRHQFDSTQHTSLLI